MKLCCFLNYAPLYRKSIFQKIDCYYDAQFYFGEEVEYGKKSGIAKLDYSIFRKKPVEFKNYTFFKYFPWRTKASLLAINKYDTFLITGDFAYSYIPLILLCKLLGKRIYGWGHGIKRKARTLQFINNFLYNNLDGYFVYGDKGKERLIELGYDAAKIHTIYNSLNTGVNPEQQENLKSSIYEGHFNNKFPVLIFVGRLTPQKKLDWIIKALRNLHDRGLNCNLMIIGDGQKRQELTELAVSLNVIDSCWFYGECYDDSKLNALIYNADMCVSPGNVGLTALHAMSYGVPVLSHDDFEFQMPEYETIIEYQTGILYKHNNYDDFVNKISKWIDFSKGKREFIRNQCYSMINGNWNSTRQIETFSKYIQ